MSTQNSSNNRDGNPKELASSCHLFEKFLVRYPGSQKNTINLYFSEKVDRNELYSKLLDKLNIYENFNFNVFSVENSMNARAATKNGVNFIIASCKELVILEEYNAHALYISKYADPHKHNIGYQRHLCPIPAKPSVSLGEYKHSKDLADTLIRKTDNLLFDINAVRIQDSFSSRSDITGLDIYEACSISRSAGLSSDLQSFCINIGDEDLAGGTEDLITLMLWYFIEGRMNQDIDTLPENNITYLVQSDISDKAIEFTKSIITGRWSFKHPNDGKVYPCTEKDYNDLIQGDIPDIILALH